MKQLLAIALPLLLLASCSASVNDPCAGRCGPAEICDAQARCLPDLPVRCEVGTRFEPGSFLFLEKDVGFQTYGVEGTRISTGDLDGDGWADLFIRRAGDHEALQNGSTPQQGAWVLRNTGGQFEDFTAESALFVRRVPDGSKLRPAEIVVLADIDNDGDLDAFTGWSTDGVSPETSEIMLNDGRGVFSFGPDTSAVRDLTQLGGATFVDVNRDGWVDLWFGTRDQDQLQIGVGTGEFFDNTDRYGLTTQPWASLDLINGGLAHTNAWSTAACDLDGDGIPELLSASYGRAPNHLWQGSELANGDIRFTNVSVVSGYAFDPRVDWTDNESARCHCQLNPADIDCAGVPPPALIRCQSQADAFRWNHATDREAFRLGGNSGTTVCADLNNDGHLDLLTTEIVHWDVGASSDPSELLFNTGEAQLRFDRPGNVLTGLQRTHTAVDWNDGDITGAVFDFDNDGRPDVLIGSTDYPGARALLFHQQEDGTFESVSRLDGIDHSRSHGVAVADFDRDGDLDVVLGHSRARCGSDCYSSFTPRYFENQTGPGNWLQLDLVGSEGSNRAGIGARVTVTAGGVTQTQEVGGGHGHYGLQRDRVLHFGLGGGCAAEVTVRWPDQDLTTEEFVLPSGYRFQIVQGGRPVAVSSD